MKERVVKKLSQMVVQISFLNKILANVVIYLGDFGNSVSSWYVLLKQLFSNVLWKIKNGSLNLILDIGNVKKVSNNLNNAGGFPTITLKFQERQARKQI